MNRPGRGDGRGRNNDLIGHRRQRQRKTPGVLLDLREGTCHGNFRSPEKWLRIEFKRQRFDASRPSHWRAPDGGQGQRDELAIDLAAAYPAEMSKPNPFRYFRTSRAIIRLAVMMYVRFPLSLRNVEDLLHERGIDVSHDSVRF